MRAIVAAALVRTMCLQQRTSARSPGHENVRRRSTNPSHVPTPDCRIST